MGWFSPYGRRTYSTSSSSYYRRRPRDGYIARIIQQLRRIFRDLLYYVRRHPMKVFMLVIMPLITGGALHSLLRQFGIRLPTSMLGGGAGGGRAFGDGFSSYSGTSSARPFSDLGGGGALQNIMRIAQNFV